MRERLHWTALILGCAAFFALLIQVPQFLHILDPRFQGVLVALNSDESVYLARVEESLIGRDAMATEAFVGDPALLGTQSAFLESLYGRLFSWTDLRAATVLQILDSVNVLFLFILLWMFLRLCGFSKRQALFGAFLFNVIELYNLNRPVHLAGSTVFTLAAIDGVLLGVRFHRGLGFAGAILLGTLFGVYLWSWMWAWAFVGILIFIQIVALMRTYDAKNADAIMRLLTFIAIGALLALPHVLSMWNLSSHPLYAEAVFRSGMRPGRSPESWPYSVLFTTMFLCVLISYVRDTKTLHRYLGVLVTITTAWVVIHQQAIHGVIFNYVSHELLLLVISALSVILLALSHRTKMLLLAAAAGAAYLIAVAYDGRVVWKQFRILPGRFDEQHLASALPVLDALPQATVLSSAHVSAFIAAQTHLDVVYSIYLKNVLMSHGEIAERYCMTVLPLPASKRHIAEQTYLVYPDAVAAFADDPTVREREVAMVEKACGSLDGDPQEALRKYRVHYILWDERSDAEWDLNGLNAHLEKISQADGWSLWEVPR